MRKAFIAAFIFCIVMTTCVYAQGSGGGGSQSSNNVTINIKDTPLPKVIETLFQASGRSYTIDSKITSDKAYSERLVNLSVKDVSFDDALKALAKAAGVTYRKEGDVYHIAPKVAADGVGAPSVPSPRQPGMYHPQVNPIVPPEGPTGAQSGVTLDLQDVPFKEAINKLFNAGFKYKEQKDSVSLYREDQKSAYYTYKFDPLMEKPPYSDITVTLKTQNAAFDDVFRRLLSTYNLQAYVETDPSWNKTYLIGPAPSISIEFPYGPSDAAATDKRSVTMRIPVVTVQDAVARIESGWTFKNNTRARMMNGASFSNFPKDMAVTMLLLAAGLKPPTSGQKVVSETIKGQVPPLSDFHQWSAGDASAQVQTSGGYGGGMGGGGLGGGGWSRGYGGYGGQAADSRISIGAYKRVSPKGEYKWLFTVLASQAPDNVLLEKLLSTSGVSYTTEDLLRRPYTMLTAIGGGKVVETTAYTQTPFTISVQLYDVTLDQALQAILPRVSLVYHKEGTKENPTYVIEAVPVKGQPGMSGGGGGSGASGSGDRMGF